MSTNSIYKTPEGERIIKSLYDKVLCNWPIPYEGLTVKTRYGDTFIIASGAKTLPPLFLIHGSCSNATSWVGEVAEYSKDFRVYAVDIIGEPGRSSETRPTWNGPAFGEWLEDVFTGLSITKAALIGISQGGWTALKFATYKPELVEKLVLLAPGGIVPPRLSFLLKVIPLSLFGGRRGAEAINRITFGDEPIHEEAVKYMNAIMTHFKPRIGKQPVFSNEQLDRLTMPTLLVVGEKDALIDSRKTAARLKEIMPKVTINVLPNKGHVLINTAERVTAFLKKDNDKTHYSCVEYKDKVI